MINPRRVMNDNVAVFARKAANYTLKLCYVYG